jgi:carbamoyl-phosphate synthase small subunit
MTQRTPAFLMLEDGRSFSGESYGAHGEVFGEAVFSTGMTGYQETLTDPSYHRQIVAMTAPHIGNTGVNDVDAESERVWVAGFVVRAPESASNFRATGELEASLAAQNVVGIAGVDTRALTRHLRERGAMRAGISSVDGDREEFLERVRSSASMLGADLVGEVTCAAPYVVPAEGERRFTIAALDLGIKRNTPRRMAARRIESHVLPATTSLEQLLARKPDGVFLSNGPGDPATAERVIGVIRGLLAQGVPLFGICFGHQLLARALGLETYKLRFGHRGINQPVQELATGKVEVTAHNHGFAVAPPSGEALETEFGQVRVSHRCLNDEVVEGLELRDASGALRAFSVQYHPEAAAGPHDADPLFDRFSELLGATGDA